MQNQARFGKSDSMLWEVFVLCFTCVLKCECGIHEHNDTYGPRGSGAGPLPTVQNTAGKLGGDAAFFSAMTQKVGGILYY